jgi:hypothetical protein
MNPTEVCIRARSLPMSKLWKSGSNLNLDGEISGLARSLVLAKQLRPKSPHRYFTNLAILILVGR